MAAAAAGSARALRADHAAKVWRQPSGARRAGPDHLEAERDIGRRPGRQLGADAAERLELRQAGRAGADVRLEVVARWHGAGFEVVVEQAHERVAARAGSKSAHVGSGRGRTRRYSRVVLAGLVTGLGTGAGRSAFPPARDSMPWRSSSRRRTVRPW